VQGSTSLVENILGHSSGSGSLKLTFWKPSRIRSRDDHPWAEHGSSSRCSAGMVLCNGVEGAKGVVGQWQWVVISEACGYRGSILYHLVW